MLSASIRRSIVASLFILASSSHRLKADIPQVVQAGIKLPFVASLFAVSSDAAVAAACEAPPMTAAGAPTPRKQTRIALVDLQKRTVVLEQEVPFDVALLAIDSNFIYLAASGDMQVHVWSALYLTPLQDLRPNHPVTSLNSVNGVLYIGVGEFPPVRIRVPRLEPLPPLQAAIPAEREKIYADHPIRVDDGWLFRGIVRDASGKVARAINPDTIVMDARPSPSVKGDARTDMRASLWGITEVGSNLQLDTADPTQPPKIVKVDGYSPLLLPQLPAIASLRRPTTTGSTPGQWSILLTDAATRTHQQTIAIRRASPEDSKLGDNTNVAHLVEAAGKLYAQTRDVINAISLPTKIDDFAVPLALSMEDPALLPKPAAPVTVTLKPNSFYAPFTYRMVSPGEHFLLFAPNKSLRYDPPINDRRAELIATQLLERGGYYDTSTPEQMVDAYMKSAGLAYVNIVGELADDPPMAIPVKVEVTDSRQQKAIFETCVITTVRRLDVIGTLRQLAPKYPRANTPGATPGRRRQGSAVTRPAGS